MVEGPYRARLEWLNSGARLVNQPR